MSASTSFAELMRIAEDLQTKIDAAKAAMTVPQPPPPPPPPPAPKKRARTRRKDVTPDRVVSETSASTTESATVAAPEARPVKRVRRPPPSAAPAAGSSGSGSGGSRRRGAAAAGGMAAAVREAADSEVDDSARRAWTATTNVQDMATAQAHLPAMSVQTMYNPLKNRGLVQRMQRERRPPAAAVADDTVATSVKPAKTKPGKSRATPVTPSSPAEAAQPAAVSAPVAAPSKERSFGKKAKRAKFVQRLLQQDIVCTAELPEPAAGASASAKYGPAFGKANIPPLIGFLRTWSAELLPFEPFGKQLPALPDDEELAAELVRHHPGYDSFLRLLRNAMRSNADFVRQCVGLEAPDQRTKDLVLGTTTGGGGGGGGAHTPSKSVVEKQAHKVDEVTVDEDGGTQQRPNVAAQDRDDDDGQDNLVADTSPRHKHDSDDGSNVGSDNDDDDDDDDDEDDDDDDESDNQDDNDASMG